MITKGTIMGQRIETIWGNYFKSHPEALADEKIVEFSNTHKSDSLFPYRFSDYRYPTWVLLELAKVNNHTFNSNIVKNQQCTPEILQQLFDNGVKNWGKEREDRLAAAHLMVYIVKHRNTTPELFWKLFNVNNNEINSLLIDNPRLPDEIFNKFCETDDIIIKINMAESSRTPAHVLEKFAEQIKLGSYHDNVTQFYEQVASNPNTPAYLLEKISASYPPYTNIVYEALANPHTPERVLMKLFPETTSVGKQYISKNSALKNETILEALKNDKDFTIRYCILENPNTPEHFYVELLNDPHLPVRQLCVKHLWEKNFFGDWPQEWVEAQYGVPVHHPLDEI